jgi:hypothetical protein
LKTYNQNNFFKHTFCEFHQVDNFTFPENTHYKSKSKSSYFYTDEGVYRKSNHWGRVANCRWKIIADEHYKNQQVVIGFAKWTHFYPMNSSGKIFYIEVDFKLKTAKLQPKINNSSQYLFTFYETLKRIKQINHLLNDDKWAKYFDLEKDELLVKVISKFINSNHLIHVIKREFN